MKFFIISGLIIINFVCRSFAQDTASFFFDKNWKDTNEKKAKYIRQEITLFNNYLIEIYKSDGTPIYKGEFSSLEPEIENGFSLHFNDEGELIEKGYFTLGYPDSLWFFMNLKTGKFDTIDYTGIRELIISKEGPFSFPETFVIVNEMPSFPIKNEDLSQVTFKDFRSYINSERYYPVIAKRKHIEGSVIVIFTIGPDGNIYDIMIPKPESKYFDYEAVRVILNSPKWSPGLQQNKAVPVRKSTYVSFYLE